MPITIDNLPPVSTTEGGDLFVLHQVGTDRTKGISYQNLLNEVRADINAVTQAQLNDAIAAITAAYQAADLSRLQLVFPVGSKIALNGGPMFSTNPATYLGFGTWQKESGYYYRGQTNDLVFGYVYGTGGTYGSTTHDHTGTTGNTTLNTLQIPSHVHVHKDTIFTENEGVVSGALGEGESTEYRRAADGVTVLGGIGNKDYDYDNNLFYFKTRNTSPAGGTQGHNHTIPTQEHYPPTMVEWVWRRTA
jgi:hypothetical protein